MKLKRWVVIALLFALCPYEAWAQATEAVNPPMGFKDWATLAIAVVGAVLGILNYINAASAKRLKVEVRPAYAYLTGNSDPIFCIGVVNKSGFAVNAEEVGFLLKDRKRRAPITNGRVIDNKPWPRRLEARESVSVYFDPFPFIDVINEMETGYVRLASGEMITGTSDALKQLIKMGRQVRNKSS